MTFHLIHDDGRALIATSRKVVKARDTQPLREAAELLTHLHALHDKVALRCAEAERSARAEGLRQGEEQGRAAFAAAVAGIAVQAADDRLSQEHQIADLALAALRRMVDDIGEEAMLVGAARRAVASVLPADDIQVHIAPGMAETVAHALAQAERAVPVTLRPDPELLPHQCRVVTASGRVIADIDRQIAAIEHRWSAAHVD